jgi:hypothetical protein
VADQLNRIKYDHVKGEWVVLWRGRVVRHEPFKDADAAYAYLDSLKRGGTPTGYVT